MASTWRTTTSPSRSRPGIWWSTDIPLAAVVVGKQATALDPRGELYTEEHIREALGMRNFMDGLRSSGMEAGGLYQADRQNFANQLVRLPRPQICPCRPSATAMQFIVSFYGQGAFR